MTDGQALLLNAFSTGHAADLADYLLECWWGGRRVELTCEYAARRPGDPVRELDLAVYAPAGLPDTIAVWFGADALGIAERRHFAEGEFLAGFGPWLNGRLEHLTTLAGL